MYVFFNLNESKLNDFGYSLLIPKEFFKDGKRISIVLPDPISVFPDIYSYKRLEEDLNFINQEINIAAIGIYHPRFDSGRSILSDLLEEFKFRRKEFSKQCTNNVDTRNYYIAIPLTEYDNKQ